MKRQVTNIKEYIYKLFIWKKVNTQTILKNKKENKKQWPKKWSRNKKHLTRIFSNEEIQVTFICMKKCSHNSLSWKCKLKSQRSIILPQLTWPLLKRQKKYWWSCGEIRYPYTLLVGMQTNTASEENSVEVLQTTKSRSSIWLGSAFSKYTSQGNAISIGKRCLHYHVHCRTINNGQVMESI